MCLGQQLESPLAHLFCRYFRSLLQLDPEPGIRGRRTTGDPFRLSPSPPGSPRAVIWGAATEVQRDRKGPFERRLASRRCRMDRLGDELATGRGRRAGVLPCAALRLSVSSDACTFHLFIRRATSVFVARLSKIWREGLDRRMGVSGEPVEEEHRQAHPTTIYHPDSDPWLP